MKVIFSFILVSRKPPLSLPLLKFCKKYGSSLTLVQSLPDHFIVALVPSPATTVQEADVTGVDLSEVMISSARQKYPKARWLVGNALALPSLLVGEPLDPSLLATFGFIDCRTFNTKNESR